MYRYSGEFKILACVIAFFFFNSIQYAFFVHALESFEKHNFTNIFNFFSEKVNPDNINCFGICWIIIVQLFQNIHEIKYWTEKSYIHA